MEHLWTWKGIYFGYKLDDYLYTYEGNCVGKFIDENIFGKDGHYIGERKNERYLIVNSGKIHLLRPPFTPYGKRGGIAKFANYSGFAMFAGYTDFPHPESFSNQ